MPKLRETAYEKNLKRLRASVEYAMSMKGWSKKHLAELLPWSVKHKYYKLSRFFRQPETLAGDLFILLDKLDLTITIESKGESK